MYRKEFKQQGLQKALIKLSYKVLLVPWKDVMRRCRAEKRAGTGP